VGTEDETKRCRGNPEFPKGGETGVIQTSATTVSHTSGDPPVQNGKPAKRIVVSGAMAIGQSVYAPIATGRRNAKE